MKILLEFLEPAHTATTSFVLQQHFILLHQVLLDIFANSSYIFSICFAFEVEGNDSGNRQTITTLKLT